MELYFSPLACSMATRIALYEANADATFVEVDPLTKRTADGRDFRTINPLGLVPLVRTDAGQLITESSAILQWLAETYPDRGLMPTTPEGRIVTREWLGFLGTEIHKLVFGPLVDPRASTEVRAYALQKSDSRLDHLVRKLGDRDYALGEFSIVDAYLVTMLGWTITTPLDLSRWPTLGTYLTRVRQRPSVKRAYEEELALYLLEKKRATA